MNELVLRYVHFYCVAFLFDAHVQCDQYAPVDSDDWRQLLKTTACASNYTRQSSIEESFKNCSARNIISQSPIEPAPFQLPSEMRVHQLCRDDVSMWLQLQVDGVELLTDSNSTASNYNITRPLIIYRLQETDNLLAKNIVCITDETTVHITELSSNTTYLVSATLVRADHAYADALNRGAQFSTQPVGQMPGPITDIGFGPFYTNTTGSHDTGGLNVDMSWKPAPDNSCFYTVVLSSNGDFIQYPKSKQPAQLNYTFRGLQFETHYSVCVLGNHRVNSYLQNNCTFKPLYTGSCHKFYQQSNRSHCDPIQPANIRYTPTLYSVESMYLLDVVWDTPDENPFMYTVNVTDEEGHRYGVSVDGHEQRTRFGGQPMLLTGETVLRVVAHGWSPGRQSSHAIELNLQTEELQRQSVKKRYVLISVIVVACGLLTLLLVVVWGCYLPSNKFQLNKIAQDEPAADDPISQLIECLQREIDATIAATSADLEIDAERVHNVCVIGHGAFGIVHRATVQPDSQTVAVKRLHTTAAGYSAQTVDDVRHFFHEIEVLKSVGAHPNIVGIVGHATRNVCQMMLITEYCAEGNLLALLHRVYGQLQAQLAGTQSRAARPEEQQQQQQQQLDQKAAINAYNCVASLTDKKPPADKQVPINMAVNHLYDDGDDGLGRAPLGKICTKCPVAIVPRSEHPHHSTDSGVDTGESISGHKVAVHVLDCNGRHAGADAVAVTIVDNPSYMLTDGIAANNNRKALAGVWTLNGTPASSPLGKVAAKQPMPSVTPLDAQNHLAIGGRDLLSMAVQAAAGMRFLADQKVVHRDLAARNVLVCADKSVKISDFGLSRDVYLDQVYRKRSEGKLPIKWMAVESLVRNVYTSQSDVWSFGVLLYELVTLGGTPYPTVRSTAELIAFLQTGGRMERPAGCSAELYALMHDGCWAEEAEQRPTFAEVLVRLEQMRADEQVSDLEHVRLREALVAGGRAGTRIRVSGNGADGSGTESADSVDDDDPKREMKERLTVYIPATDCGEYLIPIR